MLEHLFKPRAIAVIGASRAPGKVGFDMMRNLVENEFPGRIYPVNPKADELFGLKCYHSVKEVPDKIDLAIFIIPPKAIPSVMKECAERGADSAIVISAGFKEVGPEGAAIEREMLSVGRESGIRILGPNCLGVIDTYSSLNASFAAGMPERGNLGFMSQSGALCTAILDWSFANGIGFSRFVSLGNKADLDEADILEALGRDKATRVIIGYIEGTNRGCDFMETAKRVSKKKPVILIKSGVSEAGARAASSHTGSMAGSDAAFTAAFEQCGIMRARTVEELFDYAVAFSSLPLPGGNKIAILTNAGGPGIMATDALEDTCAQMAVFGSETIEKLKEKLPPTAAFFNPVDIIGDARADRYEYAMNTLLDDPGVNGIVILLTPQGMTQIEETAKAITFATMTYEKPILAGFMGEDMVASGIHILRKSRVPNYGFPERAVAVFSRMAEYAYWKDRPAEKPVGVRYNKKKLGEMIRGVVRHGKFEVGGEKALRLISAAGIRIPKYEIAEDIERAKKVAGKFGYPIVMKVASPDISHKSDVGGVVVGIADEQALVRAYNHILVSCRRAVPQAMILGVEIHQMVKGGKEMVVGMTRDRQFGPLVMFGLGGIYVEVMKDVSFKVAPMTESDIERMIYGIKGVRLLTGVRGEKGKD
ncbi:MAG: acetate--CoA ligase alpha subunit, partial [bacterium]